jgi:hypothetical protein
MRKKTLSGSHAGGAIAGSFFCAATSSNLNSHQRIYMLNQDPVFGF